MDVFDDAGRLQWPIETNRSDIDQGALNIASKNESNPLPWRGQFSPQFVRSLLENYASSGARVLDPFVGSGTTLLECSRLGLSGVGAELNPAAVALARLYEFCTLGLSERERELEVLVGHLRRLVPEIAPTGEEDLCEIALRELASSSKSKWQSILRDGLIVRLDVGNGALLASRLREVFLALRRFVMSLPVTSSRIEVLHADARKLPHIEPVDLVLTSPPYVNVFNYHQQYRGSAEVLRWDLLSVAQSEIGSNRKFRQNRFLTVVQYCLDMALALEASARTLARGGRLVFIVGRESFVRKTRIFNGELLAALAQSAVGLDLHLRQERSFTNRFGQQIWEEILHFRLRDTRPGADLKLAREIGRTYLQSALDRVPDAEQRGLEDALAGAEHVHPSRFFNAGESTVENK